MTLFLAVIFLLVCGVLIFRLRRAEDGLDVQLGLLAAFSVGYFCLPVFFSERSGLSSLNQADLASVILIFLIFFVAVLLGAAAGRGMFRRVKGPALPKVDSLFQRHRLFLALAGFGWFLYYSTSRALTSYASDDFERYFDEGRQSSAIPSLLADVAVAWIVYCLAIAWREKKKRELIIYSGMLMVALSLLLLVGQRLAFIAPIAALIGVLGAIGEARKAVRVVILCVVALGLISPIAVAIRVASDGTTAASTVSTFDYGDSPVDTVFQSILDRGDLLYVSTRIRPALDEEHALGLEYYGSVVLGPIPSQLLPGGQKPYLLSSNGEPSGEISILAWRRIHGDTVGSLSAFGGIVAYREFGWPGVVLNGMAVGLLFAGTSRLLGSGASPLVALYGMLFVDFSVRKVPPSFWEAAASLLAVVPLVLALLVFEAAIPGSRSRGHRAPVADVAGVRKFGD